MSNLTGHIVFKRIVLLLSAIILVFIAFGCTQRFFVLTYSNDRVVSLEDDVRIAEVIDGIFLNNGFEKHGSSNYEYYENATDTKYVAKISGNERVEIHWHEKRGQLYEKAVESFPEEVNAGSMTMIEKINSQIEKEISEILKKEVKILSVVLPGP